MTMECGIETEKLISRARDLLVMARIYRQEANISSEFDSYYQEIGGDWSTTDAFLKKAKECRLEAKDCLIKAEMLNGEAYLFNLQNLRRLYIWLRGKGFRRWQTYHDQYAANHLFRGVDPE